MELSDKIELVDINRIKPDPNNPRKRFDEKKLAEHATAYKRHGQIMPIEIDEKNTIISGELRWRTCKLAGIRKIRCIRVKKLDTDMRLERQTVENHCRSDMEIKEYLPVVKKMLKEVEKEQSLRATSKGSQKGKKGGQIPENGKTADHGYSEVARRIGASETAILTISKSRCALNRSYLRLHFFDER